VSSQPHPCDEVAELALMGLTRLAAARDSISHILEGRLKISAPLLLHLAALFLRAAGELEQAERWRAEDPGEAA
jgi:hypothetical protein